MIKLTKLDYSGDYYCEITKLIDGHLKDNVYKNASLLFGEIIHYILSEPFKQDVSGDVKLFIRKAGYTLGSITYNAFDNKITKLNLNKGNSFIEAHYKVPLEQIENLLNSKYAGRCLEF